MLHITYITNPFQPNKGRKNWSVKGKKSINALVKTHRIDLSLPTICLINGQAILRKDWNIPLNTGIVSFVSLPLGGGGGGSNPINIVLTVALVVATVYTGGLVGAAYGAVWGGIAAAGVSFRMAAHIFPFVRCKRKVRIIDNSMVVTMNNSQKAISPA